MSQPSAGVETLLDKNHTGKTTMQVMHQVSVRQTALHQFTEPSFFIESIADLIRSCHMCNPASVWLAVSVTCPMLSWCWALFVVDTYEKKVTTLMELAVTKVGVDLSLNWVGFDVQCIADCLWIHEAIAHIYGMLNERERVNYSSRTKPCTQQSLVVFTSLHGVVSTYLLSYSSSAKSACSMGCSIVYCWG